MIRLKANFFHQIKKERMFLQKKVALSIIVKVQVLSVFENTQTMLVVVKTLKSTMIWEPSTNYTTSKY